MNEEPEKTPDSPDNPAGFDEEIPEIEDWNAPDAAQIPIEEAIAEDDPDLLDVAARALEVANDVEDGAGSEKTDASAAALADDSSDTDAIPDEPEPAGDTKERPRGSSSERAAHSIAVKLKHVESSVRKLLENRDPRRKRRLGGTRRWLDLEEDILSWRFTGRFEEETLDQLAALIAQRHYLFDQLRFYSTVRPAWRTHPA